VEPGKVVSFEKGAGYTRQQICEAFGGSRREALPTRGGRVVCACLMRRMNPRAPEEVVIGSTKRMVERARALAASGEAVPVLVSERSGMWEYAGERRVRAVIEDPGALLALVAEGAPADVSLALVLEEALTTPAPTDGVLGGAPPSASGA
jgi:hypothetical protein